RDVAFGLRLIFGVGRPDRGEARPPVPFLVRARGAGAQVEDRVAVLQGDVGIRDQVQVPDRMLRRAAQRRDHGVHAVVLDAHERGLPQLARLATLGGEDHAGRAFERAAFLAAGRLVEPYLLGDAFPGARLVLTGERHRRVLLFGGNGSPYPEGVEWSAGRL